MSPDPQQNLVRFGRTVTSIFVGGIGLVLVLMLWAVTHGPAGV